MIGVKFTQDVNNYKDGGVVDVPYPYQSYVVIYFKPQYYMTSKYDLNARFIKKAQVYDDEIDLQNATQSETNTEIVVLNGEEIIYETIENQNKDLVILIISIV